MTTDLSHLKVPTIHLNGTSRGELQRQLIEAIQALDSAIYVLQFAAPHSRDYYPQNKPGDGIYDAFTPAAEQHQNRIKKLADVSVELNHILEKITYAD